METSYKMLNIGDKLQDVFKHWRQVIAMGTSYKGCYSIGNKLQEAVTALETSYNRLLQHWRQVTRSSYSIGNKLQEAVTALETSYK